MKVGDLYISKGKGLKHTALILEVRGPSQFGDMIVSIMQVYDGQVCKYDGLEKAIKSNFNLLCKAT